LIRLNFHILTLKNLESLKFQDVQISRLTNAKISANVASPFLLYQEEEKTGNVCFFNISIANKQINEKSDISRGVVLAMALSDHCRCVSIPNELASQRMALQCSIAE
jgi:hypothetical protein